MCQHSQLCPHKPGCVDVHSDLIHHNPKPEATHIPSGGEMEGNKISTQMIIGMNLKNSM